MSRRTQRNVGIIGLGIIGQRVAEGLRRHGFSVFVWNRTPRPFPNFVGSPAEIAQLSDYIQIFVADDEALLEMARQLKPVLKAHHIVIASCTVAPHTMREAAEIVQRRGAQFLDAPFTGSKLAAEKCELVYYVGGDDAAFKRARPVLEASSKEIIEIGEIGQATTIKIATNMVTAATIQVAAEALAIVHNAGLTPDKFIAAMHGNSSNSGTLTMKLPKMVEGDFDPHFSVKHMLKDVHIASRLGRSHGLSLGATEAARSSLLEEVRQNRGDYDYSSMVHAYFPEATTLHPLEEKEEEEEIEQPTLDLTEATPAPKTELPLEEAGTTETPEQDEAIALDTDAAAPNEESEELTLTVTEPPLENSDDAAPDEEAVIERAEFAAAPDEEATEEAETTKPTSEVIGTEGEGRRGFLGRIFGKGFDY